MDIFKALRIAIRAETAAKRMYNKLAEDTSDPEVKSFFTYLAEYEEMHQRFLEAEIRAFSASHEDKEAKPSHWLKMLMDEARKSSETDGSIDENLLDQCRLNLSVAENIAMILENANKELLQKQVHYESELTIAAEIQKKLLPHEFPKNTDLQIAGFNTMARSVGGDYYDLISNERGQIALIVADSMGKGMPAALLMTTLRSVWRSSLMTGFKWPDQTLDMINQIIYPDLKATESFVTVFGAVYDPATSIFRYSSAGHNPPLFLTASNPQCRQLDVGGIPVGIFPDSEYPMGELPISEGDVIVIYTDGIVEAVDGANRPFGFEKLCDLVDQNRGASAEEIKNSILSAVDDYTGNSPQADDITIMVLRKV